jgi:hypothetical protein
MLSSCGSVDLCMSVPLCSRRLYPPTAAPADCRGCGARPGLPPQPPYSAPRHQVGQRAADAVGTSGKCGRLWGATN